MSESLNKYRFKFSKTDKMRFIGHLDMLKLFQRAVKRAKLPISYSKGFNPHQIISFASPLPLGMASVGEYSDFRLDVKTECDEIKNALNAVLPEGMEIIEVYELNEGSKNSAALVDAAQYEIIPDKEIKDLENVIKELLNADTLMIERTSKSKTKEVNIREDIYKLYCEDGVIKALIATGSKKNLKPELLTEYIYRHRGLEFDPIMIKTKRIELFAAVKSDGMENFEFVPLARVK